jgi:two-component system nitrate/nitrite sensor histidine kinase NarX
MQLLPGRLSRKIVGMLFLFLLIALAAIGWTLYLSWQLEGVAAAINDAGSQRMRTYRIAHLMEGDIDAASATAALAGEVERFDRVLRDLRHGDRERPMAPPRNSEVHARLLDVEASWRSTIAPLVNQYLSPAAVAGRTTARDAFGRELEAFVGRINDLVLAMEHSYARDTGLLRRVQAGLGVLALIGTAVLLHFFTGQVIRPLGELRAGIRRMGDQDLSVRLPVTRRNEFGDLANGFNRMAERLETAYGTLEQRVEAETRALALRNRELGILYEITSFLGESAPVDAICEGFLTRIRAALGADAGTVRLYSASEGLLYLTTHQGLSEEFVTREASMKCGDCLCGELIVTRTPVSFDTDRPPPGMKLRNCIREGFATAGAFNVLYNRQQVGVFNLYFRERHAVSEPERDLLETLGQHLGVAVENQRLRSREKVLAVSEERNLLAQELHDSIAQGLAFLNIQAQLLEDSLKRGRSEEALQTVSQLREGVQESYDDVRELLVHFRTSMHQADLDSALRETLEKFEGQTGIATLLENRGEGLLLEPAEETQVMHIVQESLSNIRKHAQATRVHVIVERSPAGLAVAVEDDGRGFDPANDPRVHSERHVGLKIMRERAHRIGAVLEITSEPGKGACVRLALPGRLAEVA